MSQTGLTPLTRIRTTTACPYTVTWAPVLQWKSKKASSLSSFFLLTFVQTENRRNVVLCKAGNVRYNEHTDIDNHVQ